MTRRQRKRSGGPSGTSAMTSNGSGWVKRRSGRSGGVSVAGSSCSGARCKTEEPPPLNLPLEGRSKFVEPLARETSGGGSDLITVAPLPKFAARSAFRKLRPPLKGEVK